MSGAVDSGGDSFVHDRGALERKTVKITIVTLLIGFIPVSNCTPEAAASEVSERDLGHIDPLGISEIPICGKMARVRSSVVQSGSEPKT